MCYAMTFLFCSFKRLSIGHKSETVVERAETALFACLKRAFFFVMGKFGRTSLICCCLQPSICSKQVTFVWGCSSSERR